MFSFRYVFIGPRQLHLGHVRSFISALPRLKLGPQADWRVLARRTVIADASQCAAMCDEGSNAVALSAQRSATTKATLRPTGR